MRNLVVALTVAHLAGVACCTRGIEQDYDVSLEHVDRSGGLYVPEMTERWAPDDVSAPNGSNAGGPTSYSANRSTSPSTAETTSLPKDEDATDTLAASEADTAGTDLWLVGLLGATSLCVAVTVVTAFRRRRPDKMQIVKHTIQTEQNNRRRSPSPPQTVLALDLTQRNMQDGSASSETQDAERDRRAA